MANHRHLLDQIGNTPLVALQHIGKDLPVPVLVKCEHLNPGGSIKDRIAVAIITDAEERGLLCPGMTIVEATAGNTGVALALVAALLGKPGPRLVYKRRSCLDGRCVSAYGLVVSAVPSQENTRRASAYVLAIGFFIALSARKCCGVYQ